MIDGINDCNSAKHCLGNIGIAFLCLYKRISQSYSAFLIQYIRCLELLWIRNTGMPGHMEASTLDRERRWNPYLLQAMQ